MKATRKRLGDLLIDSGLLTDKQVGEALQQSKTDNIKLGEELVKLGFVTESQIADALADQLDLPRYDPQTMPVNEQVINLCPDSVYRKNSIFPIDYVADSFAFIYIVMSDPMDLNAMDDFQIASGVTPQALVATKSEVSALIDKYFASSESKKAEERFISERRAEFGDLLDKEKADKKKEELEKSPVVQLVNTMLQQAARQGTSDIHVEPMEDRVRVRFRIDGVLHEKFSYSNELLSAITARLKIMSGLDISEKRRPQDGRATIFVDHVEYDIRVSMLPTVYGEKCVMRLQEKTSLQRSKAKLGFFPDDLEKFDHLLKNPNGILLVTGPTGSGKSTTLYTVLSELNKEGVNIITVEDPVEANVPGVNQVQTNDKAGLTFASALRSILRQDPDIIMIGEIRDAETAEIAVRASITGHLVLSTLHTNSAAKTIARLIDMGIAPYMIADSVFGIIAQRLVRKLCPYCKQEYEASESEKKLLGVPVDKPCKLYKPVGCDKCNGNGYKGRIGVYEIMTVTDKLSSIIAKGGDADAIKEEAMKEGMITLAGNAARLVLNGTTTVAEAERIAFEN